ncbi:ABC transporter substrate-binding protein [Leptothoe sp. ISB3NOV94-8A]|uniref:ABC transporter substrate-binding protein n=1 Tax=Adonisia turfae CCMR0081 TaxID=2292702 RepID=A0A6M0RLY2_9CYAN|nr:ABC transporter substrate-binding protein [Adonisia turfae]MDV3352585.1 ABC transporter substrate-binding protein [Leptothoe sp. LEGE 181152]NEZ57238.1 ABC transporter substrate-binding protein [Adonisia turfae CCMR0081]
MSFRMLRKWLYLLMSLVMVVAIASCSIDNFKARDIESSRLVYSILSDPKTFNYALNSERPNIFGMTYKGLIAENYETGEIEPELAESWEFSNNGLALTYTLRENLKWSDGEPLTVDDVIFTYNDVFLNDTIPTQIRDVLRIGEEGKLPKVIKLNERQVKFEVPEPFAPFLRNTGVSILPKHALANSITQTDAEGNPLFLSTWGTSTAPNEIVCNGPYMLKAFTPGERVVFERNPYYWRTDDQGQPQPYLQEVIWQVVESQDSEFVQFRSGGLDLTGVKPDNFSLLKREEERGDFTIYNGGPAPSSLFISFNLNKGSRDGKPLVDPVKSRWFNALEFRQAVAYAIDRPTMLNNIYQGLGVLQNSSIFPLSPYSASPEEDGVRAYDYNLEKAKDLLLSAGFQYDANGQLQDADGNQVRFTLITNAGNKVREAIGAQIKQDLSKIGITVDFNPVSWGSLVEKLGDSLDWECHMISLVGGLEPNGGSNVWNPDGGLHAFNQKPLPGQDPIEGREVADWEARIGQLYIKGAQELDEAKRREIYVEAQRIVQEQLPFIYLINQYSMAAIRNKVQNVKYSPLGALWNIYELSLAEQ